jgi:GT2 family glycosyltransferase
VALTYGRQRGDHRTRFSEHQIFQQWFPDHPLEQQDHPFCNNANAAIRRRLWEELPYDESLTGLEDVAWARQAQQRGLRIVYVPEAVVIHVHEETPARIFRRYQREAMALRRIDPDSRVGLLDFIRLFATNCSLDLAVARQQGAVLRHLRGILLFRFLQFWGTHRGFARRRPASTALSRVLYYPNHRPTPRFGPRSQATRIGYGSGERDGR